MRIPHTDDMDIRYDIGDIIEYGPFGGGTRIVLVEGKYEDIKNGRPGFDGRIVNLEPGYVEELNTLGVWGYDDQIIRVVRRA